MVTYGAISLRKQGLTMIQNDPKLIARYENIDSAPFERKIMFIKNIVMSQNQELIFTVHDHKKDQNVVTIDAKNRYNQTMIFDSLFGQIGRTDSSDGKHVMVININELVNRWCIFSIQNYITNSGIIFSNVKDIILLDSQGKILDSSGKGSDGDE